MKMKLAATAAFGLEGLVGRELKGLGMENVEAQNARVYFEGGPLEIARSNLFLRCSDRVYMVLAEFPAITFQELFEGVSAIPWEDFIPRDGRVHMTGKCVKSTLMSVPDCQSIAKKAVVERLKKCYRLNWMPEDGPVFRVEISVLKDRVSVLMDTSGDGLHKRGYRILTGEAPIRETLAAALIKLSRWHPDRPLMDPMCGTGTIPVEAALIGRNIAPGLMRSFAGEAWPFLGSDCWARAREEARDALNPEQKLTIVGSDIDDKALSMARYHAKKAGVGEIHFQRMELSEVTTQKQYGFVVTNPPYGKRLGEEKAVVNLYHTLRRVMKDKLPTWGLGVFTAFPDFERIYGKRADFRRKLYNGKLECQFYQYKGMRPPWLQKVLDENR